MGPGGAGAGAGATPTLLFPPPPPAPHPEVRSGTHPHGERRVPCASAGPVGVLIHFCSWRGSARHVQSAPSGWARSPRTEALGQRRPRKEVSAPGLPDR